MLSSSTSRMFVAAVAGMAIAFGTWYGLRSDSQEKDMESRMNPTPLSLPAEIPAVSSVAGGEEDRPGVGEATVRKQVALLRDDLATLRSQLQAQAAQLRTIGAALDRTLAPPRRVPESRRASPTDYASQEAKLLAEEKERSAKWEQANDTEFSAQAVDPRWANQADDLIKQAFTSDELQNTIPMAMECRSTLCRVEVVHKDASERSWFEHHLPSLVADLLPSIAMHTTEHSDGSSVSVVYLAREGHPLPQDAVSND